MPSCKPWGWQISLPRFDNSNVTTPFRSRLSREPGAGPRYNQFCSLRDARFESRQKLSSETRETRGLDRKSTLEILRVLNRQDARVALAVRRELPEIARAVDAIVKFSQGRTPFSTSARERADGWQFSMRRNAADFWHAAENGAGDHRWRLASRARRRWKAPRIQRKMVHATW